MLKSTIKWRFEFKPDKIQWEYIAQEASMRTLYIVDYLDKQGKVVLDFELNTSSSNLIEFDEPFLMVDEPFDNALSSLARNPIEPNAYSPSSPSDMIVKLVEMWNLHTLIDDSPSPDLYDPKVNLGVRL
ncbi:hypothetical protein TanjilG_10906 [Lupinus angustifolius]|nr:hypothetical protein TanjilG_10906 [Lupinus angustifolius]